MLGEEPIGAGGQASAASGQNPVSAVLPEVTTHAKHCSDCIIEQLQHGSR